MSENPAPSKATLRKASFKYVNGSALLMPCNHDGYASIGKNVPLNKNCGNVITLASGGITLSLLAMPDITKPNPIKTISPIADNNSISTRVVNP